MAFPGGVLEDSDKQLATELDDTPLLRRLMPQGTQHARLQLVPPSAHFYGDESAAADVDSSVSLVSMLLAAVRETHEETGLVLPQLCDNQRHWKCAVDTHAASHTSTRLRDFAKLLLDLQKSQDESLISQPSSASAPTSTSASVSSSLTTPPDLTWHFPAIFPFMRFVTPVHQRPNGGNSPFAKLQTRRFDTMFFVAVLDPYQSGATDSRCKEALDLHLDSLRACNESADLVWLPVEDAIAAHHSSNFVSMPPQLVALERLHHAQQNPGTSIVQQLRSNQHSVLEQPPMFPFYVDASCSCTDNDTDGADSTPNSCSLPATAAAASCSCLEAEATAVGGSPGWESSGHMTLLLPNDTCYPRPSSSDKVDSRPSPADGCLLSRVLISGAQKGLIAPDTRYTYQSNCDPWMNDHTDTP